MILNPGNMAPNTKPQRINGCKKANVQ